MSNMFEMSQDIIVDKKIIKENIFASHYTPLIFGRNHTLLLQYN